MRNGAARGERSTSGREIALYFGLLMLSLGLADPLGLVNLPILFLLKDRLGAGPPAVAAFQLIVLLPVYCGFLFGFLRDRWRPFGLGDRFYLLMAAPLAVSGYVFLATHRITYGTLLTLVFLIMLAFQFMDTSAQALLSSVGQRHRITGRLSAVAELLEVAPKVLAMLVGGWMVTHAASPLTFLVAAALTACIGAQALWRPASIFGEMHISGPIEESRAALRRLLRHPPLWPTAAILLLWNFTPGWETPLFFYLTDKVGISSEAFGICKAIYLASIAITALFYGKLSERHTLRQMLLWGVLLNLFPGFLFLFVHDAPQAFAAWVIAGSACALGNIAVFDLLLRSCPKQLEGTAMMLGFSALTAAEGAGDVVGSLLYQQGGLLLCLAGDSLATLCILLLLHRVPNQLVDTRDHALPETAEAPAKAA